MTPIATPEIPPLPEGYLRTDWRRALTALRALLRDPDDTAQAIVINLAIGARDFERTFQRFASSASGRALLAERPSLAAALCDRAALERLPDDSLGRAYLEYLERTGFRTMGLVELERETRSHWQSEQSLPNADPVRDWYAERVTLMHDLFHVVTGYGTDDLGETTLLVFTQAQAGGRANGLLTTGAAFDMYRFFGSKWLGYAASVWRRGRRATSLHALPWEELLPMRLTTVRRLARLHSPEEAHPAGILRGRRLAQGGLELS